MSPSLLSVGATWPHLGQNYHESRCRSGPAASGDPVSITSIPQLHSPVMPKAKSAASAVARTVAVSAGKKSKSTSVANEPAKDTRADIDDIFGLGKGAKEEVATLNATERVGGPKLPSKKKMDKNKKNGAKGPPKAVPESAVENTTRPVQTIVDPSQAVLSSAMQPLAPKKVNTKRAPAAADMDELMFRDSRGTGPRECCFG